VILVMSVLYLSLHSTVSRSQWPCGLGCDTAAARLLGICVRMPPWISASCRCCVLSETIYATDCSVVQRSPNECGVPECDREASIMRRPWPAGGCCAGRGRKFHCIQFIQPIVQISVQCRSTNGS